MTHSPAPKPPNFAAMVDAWDQPETFAALVREYYRSLEADRSRDVVDVTRPRRSALDI
ncbi:hypothetical protein [Microbacterium sp. E-13]|uniref:hypothetical protein n=1 Tax=Microbacterium sp. E-13 TaxID=3404048 RepID=UPI003CF9E737